MNTQSQLTMSVQSVALASLTATYTDSEGEDGLDDEVPVDNPRTPLEGAQGTRALASPTASNSPTISVVVAGGGKPAAVEASVVSSKMQRLVSYFDDTVVSDDEGHSAVTLGERASLSNGEALGEQLSTVDDNSPNSRQQRDLLSDVTTAATTTTTTTTPVVVEKPDPYAELIPPEPPGQCPTELQEKITKLFKKMETGGLDMNKVIQQRKDFRNPSIYEKLIQFCSINELGTNYPIERFDPFKWNKDSYYEELAKVQKTEMDKLEKARKDKTKIEIVSGTAKRPAAAAALAAIDEENKKRKSKWDQVAAGAPSVSVKSNVLLPQPTLTTLTSTTTGTKATVISAFGSLPKKRL